MREPEFFWRLALFEYFPALKIQELLTAKFVKNSRKGRKENTSAAKDPGTTIRKNGSGGGLLATWELGLPFRHGVWVIERDRRGQAEGKMAALCEADTF